MDDDLLNKILEECECSNIYELESVVSDESYSNRVANIVIEHYKKKGDFIGDLSDLMDMVDEDDIPDGDGGADDDGDIVLRDEEGEYTL